MKNIMIRTGALTALAATAMLAGVPAHASVLLDTAFAVPGGSGDYPVYGDGTNGNSNFIGAAFQVTTPESALSVTANIDAYGATSGGATGDGGNQQAFAEIVSLSSLSSLPAVPGTPGSSISSWLVANDLGHSVFTVPSVAGDVSTVLNFSSALGAGNYAVIFGSGLYGATGGINLTSGNTTNGTPNIFSSATYDSFASVGPDSGIRIAVASPVPLPAGLPLLLSGLGGLGLVGRRAARKAALQA